MCPKRDHYSKYGAGETPVYGFVVFRRSTSLSASPRVVGSDPSPGAPRAQPPSSVRSSDESRTAQSTLKINGVLKRGDSRLALINNNIYREGDVITVTENGREYRFLVKSIGDEKDQVILEPLSRP